MIVGILNATGIDLHFQVPIELGSESSPFQESIDLINQLVQNIFEKL